MKEFYKFTKEDLHKWQYFEDYFLEILNYDYKIEDARNDLLSILEKEGK